MGVAFDDRVPREPLRRTTGGALAGALLAALGLVLAASCAGAGKAASGSAPAATAAAGGSLRISYEDISQVEITSPGGTRVCIDVSMPAFLQAPLAAGDILLSSHDPRDHLDKELYASFPQEAPWGKPFDIRKGDLRAYSVPSAMTPDAAAPETSPDNAIIVVEAAGLRVAHLGYCAQTRLSPAQLALIGEVDVAFVAFQGGPPRIPAGEPCGFDIAAQLGAKLIVPTFNGPEAMERQKAEYACLWSDAPELSITKADLPDRPSVLFLGSTAAAAAEATGATVPAWAPAPAAAEEPPAEDGGAAE